MKKTILILSILTAVNCSFGQIKNGHAYYSKSKISNTDLPKEIKQTKLGKAVKESSDRIGNLEYKLSFNDSLAKYFFVDKMVNDDDETTGKIVNAILGIRKNDVYFSKKGNLITTIEDIFGKTYKVQKKLDAIEWELTKEHFVINDLVCFKALTTITEEGRNGVKKIPIIAWYAPSINIPYGPDGFGGLPGIIVQLENDKIVTSLNRIEYTEEVVKIDEPKKGEKISDEDFKALIKDMVMNRRKYYGKQ